MEDIRSRRKKECTPQLVRMKGRTLRLTQRLQIHQFVGRDSLRNMELPRRCLRGLRLPLQMFVTDLNLQLKQLINKQKYSSMVLELTHPIVFNGSVLFSF